MLLQIDAMTEVAFTLKDVIYIVGFILSLAGGFFSLKNNNKATNESLKVMETKQKEDVEILHKRIERTQEDLKIYVTKTESEFKEITEKLSTINLSLGEIKGLLKK